MSELASKTCVPCRGGVPPLAGNELQTSRSRSRVASDRRPSHRLAILHSLTFARRSISSIRLAISPKKQGHHPDILLSWGKAEVTSWTHKINGLTESDFILAAKIDQFQP